MQGGSHCLSEGANLTGGPWAMSSHSSNKALPPFCQVFNCKLFYKGNEATLCNDTFVLLILSN
jgi:hypothetical protein